MLLAHGLASCKLERAVLGSSGALPHAGGINPLSLLIWRNAQVRDIARVPVLDSENVYTLSRTHVVSALAKAEGRSAGRSRCLFRTPSAVGLDLRWRVAHWSWATSICLDWIPPQDKFVGHITPRWVRGRGSGR